MPFKRAVGRAGARSVLRRAGRLAKDPRRAQRLVDAAAKKSRRREGALAGVWDSLMTLMRLVRAWATGRYRRVPWHSIVLAIAGVLYFVMPLDLVPDWIIGAGLLDDAAVIAWVAKSIKDDLDAFARWEELGGLGNKH
jgi:uncharacterized membrane protein YkvA (DUF1232 family)